jgi:hypothetical protein
MTLLLLLVVTLMQGAQVQTQGNKLLNSKSIAALHDQKEWDITL